MLIIGIPPSLRVVAAKRALAKNALRRSGMYIPGTREYFRFLPGTSEYSFFSVPGTSTGYGYVTERRTTYLG